MFLNAFVPVNCFPEEIELLIELGHEIQQSFLTYYIDEEMSFAFVDNVIGFVKEGFVCESSAPVL